MAGRDSRFDDGGVILVTDEDSYISAIETIKDKGFSEVNCGMSSLSYTN